MSPSGEKLLGIVYGTHSGEPWGHGAKSPQSFPARFLKAPSTEALPGDRRAPAESMLQQTFLLGLVAHLVLWQFPTRDRFDRVHMEALEGKWLRECLVADQQMMSLDKAAKAQGQEGLLGIFEQYYRLLVDPLLKKSLGIGFWGRAQGHSAFRNVFCCGWLLGMTFDLATHG